MATMSVTRRRCNYYNKRRDNRSSNRKAYICDMTQGNEIALLLRFAFPMLIGNIFQQFYNMVDSIVVGRYVGGDALGAVGSVGSISFLFFSLCMGLGNGIGILVSQYFGAKDEEKVKAVIANAIYITLFTGIMVSIVGVVLSRPILKLMQTPDGNFSYALTYMRIVCGATVVVAIYNTVSAILRALGDSKTPLIFLVVASVINIALDLLFVLVFDMKVSGVALATIIAQAVSAIGSVLFGIRKNEYLRLNVKDFAVQWDIIKKSIKIGIPLSAQSSLIALSCVVLQGVVNHYGETVMATFTATNRVEQIVHQPFNSLGTALSTFAGQNMGAKKQDRIIKGCKKSLWIVLGISAAMIIVMYAFGEPIMRIFIDDPEIIALGAKGLRITSLMYLFLGLIYTMRGLLNGVGDVSFSMMNGVCEVVGRVGFAILLLAIPAIGIWGVWYTNGFTWLLTGLMSTVRFCRGKWKTKSVVS